MSEPLFLQAEVDISAAALRRWLKSAPLSAATFADWPDSLFRSDSGIAEVPAPAEASVADALVAWCVDNFGAGNACLHCSYDEQAKQLRFAAYFQYGDEAGVMESAISLCALLRGMAKSYAAKTPSFIGLFDLGGDLLGIEISKKASRVLADPLCAPSPSAWFGAWLGQENFNDPEHLMAALLPPLAAVLKKQLSFGALRATRQAPYHYDNSFCTDGERVYCYPHDRPPFDTPVSDVDPRTFRRLTPANGFEEAFYVDVRQVWYYYRPAFPEGRLVPVQPIAPGMSIRGWRPFGADGYPLLRCGNTVWAAADVYYTRDTKGMNGKSNVEKVLCIIQSQGGIPLWEKLYNHSYLRPTEVDGVSFAHVKDNLFADANSVYEQTSEGLIRTEKAVGS
jgi:hypothetical protein